MMDYRNNYNNENETNNENMMAPEIILSITSPDTELRLIGL